MSPAENTSEKAAIETVTGTVVAASHLWASRRHGQRNHEVRLENGSLLDILVPMNMLPAPGGKKISTLSELYNNAAASGVGHKLEIRLVWQNTAGKKTARVVDVKDLGVDANAAALGPRKFTDKLLRRDKPIPAYAPTEFA